MTPKSNFSKIDKFEESFHGILNKEEAKLNLFIQPTPRELETREQYKKQILDPRFVKIFGAFSLAYAFIVFKSYYSENPLIRISAAGSLTFLCCEASFFPMDAINLRQKLAK